MRLPTDVREWIERQAGQHKMTKTEVMLQLLTKGIQAETIDDTVARIQQAGSSGPALELLRQTLAVRYIVEAQAKGKVSMTERIGTDALVWADKELTKMFPDRSTS